MEKIKIEYIKITDLIPSEYNPREASEIELRDIENSLNNFGMVEPIVVNSNENRKNIIIGGHQRYYLLSKMGEEFVPVVYVNIPEIEKERELNLRLNKNTGHWSYDLLANYGELELVNVGFDKNEIENMFLSKELLSDELEKELRNQIEAENKLVTLLFQLSPESAKLVRDRLSKINTNLDIAIVEICKNE